MEDSCFDSRTRRKETAQKSREEWEKMKPDIRKYYIEERRSFEELRDLMESEHEFKAT